eukprot:2074797-Amphidinium_carterae.1
MLAAIAQYITRDSPISFAYAANRNAESLQLSFAQATKLMQKRYGHVAIAKTDISAAFDTVPWGSLHSALCKQNIPSNLATALVQLKIAGFQLEWEHKMGTGIFMPTRGTRRGCKMGPALYKIFIEDLLEPLAASWKWAPRRF